MDCDEAFSTIVKPTTIQTVLTIGLSKSWTILHWMLSIFFYMTTFMKPSICIRRWVLEILFIQIMYVCWRDLYIASNRLLALGINCFLILSSLLVSYIANIVTFSLFVNKEIIDLHSSLCWWHNSHSIIWICYEGHGPF
jgi:hypothetical protein